MMRTKLGLEEPKGLMYENLKKLNNDYLDKEFSSNLNLTNMDYMTFEDNFVNVLIKHEHKKTKVFRENQKPHVSKTLILAIMKCSHLKNKAPKS